MWAEVNTDDIRRQWVYVGLPVVKFRKIPINPRRFMVHGKAADTAPEKGPPGPGEALSEVGAADPVRSLGEQAAATDRSTGHIGARMTHDTGGMRGDMAAHGTRRPPGRVAMTRGIGVLGSLPEAEGPGDSTGDGRGAEGGTHSLRDTWCDLPHSGALP